MTKGHGAKLPRKKQHAIAALLVEPTLRQAAKTAGVGEKTIWRWLRDEDFNDAYREAKRRVVDQAVSRLAQITLQAVNTLEEIVTNSEAPASTRVRGAQVILELATKSVETEDLTRRVERLEELIERRR